MATQVSHRRSGQPQVPHPTIRSTSTNRTVHKLVGAQNIDINNNDKYLIIDFDKMHFWLINKNHIDDMSKSPAGTPRQLSFLFGGVFVPVHEAYKCDDY